MVVVRTDLRRHVDANGDEEVASRKGAVGRRGVRLLALLLIGLVLAGVAVGVYLFARSARSATSAVPASGASGSIVPVDPSGPPGAVVRIAPNGTGRGDTASWSDAAPLSALPDILAAARPGTQVWLRADAGPYRLTQPLGLSGGGIGGAPAVVRGVDAQGAPQPAEIVGDRADPYDPHGAAGVEALRLLGGADHLVFQDLAFRNVGDGAFRIAADVQDLTIRQVTATNVRRFIENNASGGASTATISGLTVANVKVQGYSRQFARIQYNSNNIVFDGDSGDSQGQDHDPFSQGIQLEGTVHNVDIRNTSMTNSVSTEGEYWNGDGFSAEEDTYDIRFTNTYAAGNTDGGYDIKSRSAVMTDVKAADNKRNFRFWGHVTVNGCTASDPKIRGGTGNQAQVHATGTAVVTMTRCTFTDADPKTVVLNVDETARLTVNDSTIENAGDVEMVEPGATLDGSGVAVRNR